MARRSSTEPRSTEHLKVLGPRRSRLWREVRAARRRHDGYRDAAIAEVAARNGLEAGGLDADIAAMKRELVDAGVVAPQRFYVSEAPGGRITASSVADRSAAQRRVAATALGEFESLRYAHNAAAAIRALRTLDAEGREQLAELIATSIDEGGARHSTQTRDGTELGAGRYRDTCGFAVGDDPSWTGPVNHARWIADVLRSGTIDSVGGPIELADALHA